MFQQVTNGKQTHQYHCEQWCSMRCICVLVFTVSCIGWLHSRSLYTHLPVLLWIVSFFFKQFSLFHSQFGTWVWVHCFGWTPKSNKHTTMRKEYNVFFFFYFTENPLCVEKKNSTKPPKQFTDVRRYDRCCCLILCYCAHGISNIQEITQHFYQKKKISVLYVTVEHILVANERI